MCPQSLINFAQACPQVARLMRHPCLRSKFHLDLRPLSTLMDNDRLAYLAKSDFIPIVGSAFPSAGSQPPLRLGISPSTPPTEAKRKVKWIRSLDLSESHITNLAPLKVAPSVELEHLHLDDAPMFFPAIQFTATAPHLDFLINLKTLSLVNAVGVNDRLLHAVAYHICPQLVDLDVAYCEGITDQGVLHLMKARAQGWDRLRFTGCVQIQGDTFGRQDLRVRRLHLDLTAIDGSVVEEGLHSTHLQYLDVRTCPWISDDEVHHLRSLAIELGARKVLLI
jgi:hypothetical protein